MRNILLGLLMLTLHSTIAQTKYSNLDDACSRNSSNATNNNARTIYIPTVAVNEYAFLDNQSTNFKRLPRGYYYHSGSNSAIQTNLRGRIISTQTCAAIVGNWQIQSTYTAGLSGDSNYSTDNEGNNWYYPPTGEFYSQMNVTALPNNKISITTDIRGWGSGAGTLKFKVDVSPYWYDKATIETLDFTNQKGKDVSIIGALFDNNGNIQDSKQTIVHFSGDASSDVPDFFKRPSTKRIGSPSYFPNFTAPVGKKNIINYGSLASNTFEFENHQYLSKGFTHLTKKGNPAVPNNVSMLSEYDTWATDNGCPPSTGGSNRQAEAVQWLADTPLSQLYQFYLPIIQAGSSHGVMFHDFEAFGYVLLGNQTACNKLASLHRAFKIANPNCLMTSYINARPIEINYGPDISTAQVAVENNKYNQPFSSLATGFYAKQVQYLDLNTGNPTGLTGYMSDNLGLGIIGDYLHRYNDNNFYAFIQEMELAKNHLPSQPLVSLFWSYIETLPSQDIKDINTIRRYYRKTNGFVYQNDYKVAVPFCEMYNRSMWINFHADGQWLWHDPHNSVDGYDFHGGNAKDVNTGNYIKDNAPNQFYSIASIGSMEISTTIGYDYSQLALYELSLNNDILPNPTLKADFSIDGGNSYFTGEDLKPASAEFKKIPVVRYKIAGNTALVLVYNKHLQTHANQTVKVRINGKTIDIVLKGQYSTLKRITIL